VKGSGGLAAAHGPRRTGRPPDGSTLNGWSGETTGLTTGPMESVPLIAKIGRSGGSSDGTVGHWTIHRTVRWCIFLLPPAVATQCWRLSSGTTGTATPQCRRFLRITAGTSVFPGKAKKIKENGKSIFCNKKSKTPFGNIVFQGKMHICAKYGNFMMKYARKMAMTKGICIENLECSYMVSLFVKVFFQILSKFKFIIFPNK